MAYQPLADRKRASDRGTRSRNNARNHHAKIPGTLTKVFDNSREIPVVSGPLARKGKPGDTALILRKHASSRHSGHPRTTQRQSGQERRAPLNPAWVCFCFPAGGLAALPPPSRLGDAPSASPGRAPTVRGLKLPLQFALFPAVNRRASLLRP